MKKLNSQYIGFITAAVMIIISLTAFYGFHQPVQDKWQYAVYVVFTAGIAWSLFAHAEREPAKISFKEFFTAGFKAFITVALVMALYTYIFYTFNTAFRDERIAENARLLQQQGDHLPREIEENSRQLRKLFMPIMVSSAIFRHIILGAIIAAVGAAFLNQKKKEALKQQ